MRYITTIAFFSVLLAIPTEANPRGAPGVGIAKNCEHCAGMFENPTIDGSSAETATGKTGTVTDQ